MRCIQFRSYQLLDGRVEVGADAYSLPIAATQPPRCAGNRHAAIESRPLGFSFNFMPGTPGEARDMNSRRFNPRREMNSPAI